MKVFANEAEYKEAIGRLRAWNEWAKQYEHKNGWISIPKDAVPPVTVTNDDRSAIELWEWKNDPPDKYSLYVSEKNGDVHTWMGQSLGSCVFGREWRDNFGGTRRSVTVHGNNGIKYVGTYYKSTGDFARIRRAKRQ